MIEKGIIDPAKVVRTALQDAASISGLLVTTEAMIAELPRDKPRCRPCRRRWNGRHGRNGWHGRYGRHGLLIQPIAAKCQKGAVRTAPFFDSARLRIRGAAQH